MTAAGQVFQIGLLTLMSYAMELLLEAGIIATARTLIQQLLQGASQTKNAATLAPPVNATPGLIEDPRTGILAPRGRDNPWGLADVRTLLHSVYIESCQSVPSYPTCSSAAVTSPNTTQNKVTAAPSTACDGNLRSEALWSRSTRRPLA